MKNNLSPASLKSQSTQEKTLNPVLSDLGDFALRLAQGLEPVETARTHLMDTCFFKKYKLFENSRTLFADILILILFISG